eukprot:3942639-Amphidinium_carterae.1
MPLEWFGVRPQLMASSLGRNCVVVVDARQVCEHTDNKEPVGVEQEDRDLVLITFKPVACKELVPDVYALELTCEWELANSLAAAGVNRM